MGAHLAETVVAEGVPVSDVGFNHLPDLIRGREVVHVTAAMLAEGLRWQTQNSTLEKLEPDAKGSQLVAELAPPIDPSSLLGYDLIRSPG